jgi:hypothetical protein
VEEAHVRDEQPRAEEGPPPPPSRRSPSCRRGVSHPRVGRIPRRIPGRSRDVPSTPPRTGTPDRAS